VSSPQSFQFDIGGFKQHFAVVSQASTVMISRVRRKNLPMNRDYVTADHFCAQNIFDDEYSPSVETQRRQFLPIPQALVIPPRQPPSHWRMFNDDYADRAIESELNGA
jgi:hypothetical protein